jgi:hypothetical protein
MSNSRSVLVVASCALAFAAGLAAAGFESDAAKRLPGPSLKPRKLGLLRLDRDAMFPAKVIPTVKRAKDAERLGGRRARSLRDNCSPVTVKIGTICMMTNTYPLEREQIGKTDYFFATQACAELGGYLPTAAELIGAAPYVKLSGRLDDNEVTASIDIDPNDGLKDRREMSADLTTVASGGRAAGSLGVSDLARGDPNAGEPDPTPVPANPSPETLHYITVYDNGDHGGFAGGAPVGEPNLFRCAFNYAQGKAGPRED